jgi:hypothetical protein
MPIFLRQKITKPTVTRENMHKALLYKNLLVNVGEIVTRLSHHSLWTGIQPFTSLILLSFMYCCMFSMFPFLNDSFFSVVSLKLSEKLCDGKPN